MIKRCIEGGCYFIISDLTYHEFFIALIRESIAEYLSENLKKDKIVNGIYKFDDIRKNWYSLIRNYKKYGLKKKELEEILFRKIFNLERKVDMNFLKRYIGAVELDKEVLEMVGMKLQAPSKTGRRLIVELTLLGIEFSDMIHLILADLVEANYFFTRDNLIIERRGELREIFPYEIIGTGNENERDEFIRKLK